MSDLIAQRRDQIVSIISSYSLEYLVKYETIMFIFEQYYKYKEVSGKLPFIFKDVQYLYTSQLPDFPITIRGVNVESIHKLYLVLFEQSIIKYLIYAYYDNKKEYKRELDLYFGYEPDTHITQNLKLVNQCASHLAFIPSFLKIYTLDELEKFNIHELQELMTYYWLPYLNGDTTQILSGKRHHYPPNVKYYTDVTSYVKEHFPDLWHADDKTKVIYYLLFYYHLIEKWGVNDNIWNNLNNQCTIESYTDLKSNTSIFTSEEIDHSMGKQSTSMVQGSS